MVSKAEIKYIQSLQIKKYRKQEQAFTVEGEKSVIELLQSNYKIKTIYGTSEFLNAHEAALQNVSFQLAKPSNLERAGTFKSNKMALAVAEIPDNIETPLLPNQYALALDHVNDPGNLGTIIRIADWYGIDQLILSLESADVYNPKVITSSMGSFTRVNVFYTDISNYLDKNKSPVIGTYMMGESVHEFNFPEGGIIVLGNEANGISDEVSRYCTSKISIPSFGHAESLNVGIAAAIVCDNLRRT